MTFRHGERVLDGTFLGLSDEGHLLLQSGGAVRAFASGEASCFSS
jgi:biotin-(acetyl-CoA carboxylase) ligase